MSKFDTVAALVDRPDSDALRKAAHIASRAGGRLTVLGVASIRQRVAAGGVPLGDPRLPARLQRRFGLDHVDVVSLTPRQAVHVAQRLDLVVVDDAADRDKSTWRAVGTLLRAGPGAVLLVRTPGVGHRRALLSVDDAPRDAAAWATVGDVAARAELHALHVLDADAVRALAGRGVGATARDARSGALAERVRRHVERWLRDRARLPVAQVHVRLAEGRVAALVAQAEASQADLVVVRRARVPALAGLLGIDPVARLRAALRCDLLVLPHAAVDRHGVSSTGLSAADAACAPAASPGAPAQRRRHRDAGAPRRALQVTDLHSGRSRTVVLADPRDAAAERSVSPFSAVGRALRSALLAPSAVVAVPGWPPGRLRIDAVLDGHGDAPSTPPARLRAADVPPPAPRQPAESPDGPHR